MKIKCIGLHFIQSECLLYPGIESEDLDKAIEEYDPAVAMDKMAEACKRMDKGSLGELEVRGVRIVILDKPVLKVVGD